MLVGIAIYQVSSICVENLEDLLVLPPMLVDSCPHKLFANKIPMHRKWVRLKCASHILHDALFMFQFLSFMRASLKSSCLAKRH